MKKLLVPFVIFVYCVPISLFLVKEYLSDGPNWGVFLIPLLVMLLVCALVVASIAGAIVSLVRSKCLSFRAVMAFKLCLIPFYIINFTFWLFASTMVFHLMFAVWPMLPFIIAYTYFTMLATSVHVIAKLISLRRIKAITTGQCVLHCLLQLVFVIDVIDCICLAIRQKKLENVPAQ